MAKSSQERKEKKATKARKAKVVTKPSHPKKFKKKKSPIPMVTITYKQKLLLTHNQEILAAKTCGCCRTIYNACLYQREWAYRATNKSPGYVQQCLELTEAKREIPWLNEPPSQTLQQAIKEVDTSMDRFFRGISGYPHFRKKFEADSFTFPQGVKNIRRTSKRLGKVFLPKFGEVSFRWTQSILGKLGETTIIRDTDGWFICFVCEIPADEVKETLAKKEAYIVKTKVGVDRGINKSLALSNGEVRNLPVDELKKVEKRIAYHQRKASKKKRGSKNYQKAQEKIKKLHRRMFHLRDNWHHQTSHELAKNHSLVVMERLSIKNMVRSAKGTIENPGTNVAAKSGLNKSIHRQGWGKLERYARYKLGWRGNHLLLVPPPGTSQTCYFCKHRDPGNRKKEKFECLKCGWACDADYNASLNILYDGLVGLLALVLFKSSPLVFSLAAGHVASACGDTGEVSSPVASYVTRSTKQEPLSSTLQSVT